MEKNLPEPFNGVNEKGRRKYTSAIDEGKNEEVAAAIRSLISRDNE